MPNVTVTVRPDLSLTVNAGPAPTIAGGSASYWQATGDNSDATYVEQTGGASNYSEITYGFTDPVIPAGATIRAITPRVRALAPLGGSSTHGTYFRLVNPSGPTLGGVSYFPDMAGIATITGARLTDRGDGTPFTAADVNAMQLLVRNGGSGSSYLRSYEVYLDVEYNRAPTATGTGPNGSTGTSRPTFTWSYADADSDAQERYRVKVFSAAAYGAVGFDPNTATTFAADSGEVVSSATSWPCNVDLENGVTYRAFIFVSDAGSNGRYNTVTASGPYATATIALTAPNAPTVATLVESTSDRVRLTISATNNLNPATSYRFEVQRSSDGGVTWRTLTRLWNGSHVDYVTLGYATTASPSVQLYDYETERGGVVSYRARVVAVKSGNNLVSAWSAVATATLPATGWRLRAITLPTVGGGINVHSEVVEWQSDERQSVNLALGRAKPIILSDVIGGERADLELALLSEADYVALEALRTRRETMLLRSPYGDHRYVRFGSSRVARHALGYGVARKYVVRVTLLEVDA